TPGGPADLHAFLWANKLLNNTSNSACIEIHYGLLSLRVLIDTKIAICGADFNVTINSIPILNWQTHPVKVNDTIQFSGAKIGKCGYLAIKGGILTPPTLGSRSTVVRDELSKITSTPLQQAQILPASSPLPHNDIVQSQVPRHYLSQVPRHDRSQVPRHYLSQVPRHYRPDYTTPLILTLFPCYQWRHFSHEQQTKLLDNTYHVSSQVNRMGCRLSGEAIAHLPTKLTSEGIALGSVQLPADGQPIVLFQDRQTIGGYPKAGVISALDCGQLFQRQRGARVNFRLGNPLVYRYKMRTLMHFFNL
ncbi:MAG: biotin-dependent carboxylase-like uncharacterized protein, partial [Moritella sp.]